MFCFCGFTGIFEEPDCNPNNLNHAVVLVGYGTEGGQDYWIIKNRSEKNNQIEKLMQIHHSFFFLPMYFVCCFHFHSSAGESLGEKAASCGWLGMAATCAALPATQCSPFSESCGESWGVVPLTSEAAHPCLLWSAPVVLTLWNSCLSDTANTYF